MKRKYNIKKTISMKQFISEFGENFSQHMKKRLLELEVRCVLTRQEENHILELKHVEHTKYECDCNTEDDSNTCQKEYAYGQLVVIDEILYFSENFTENAGIMQSPIVSTIYSFLSSENIIPHADSNAKKIDDSNIDYLIDTILTVCPQVSQPYLDIISKYNI